MSIDCQDVLAYDSMLYTQLVNYPGEVIPLFDSEANLIAHELSGHDVSWTSMDMTLKARPQPRALQVASGRLAQTQQAAHTVLKI